MTYQDIFKRYELKFLITDEQLKRMQEVMRNTSRAIDSAGVRSAIFITIRRIFF